MGASVRTLSATRSNGPLSATGTLAAAGAGFAAVFALSWSQQVSGPTPSGANSLAHVVILAILTLVAAAVLRRSTKLQRLQLSVVAMLAAVIVTDSVSSLGVLPLSLPLSFVGTMLTVFVLVSSDHRDGSIAPPTAVGDFGGGLGRSQIDTIRALRGLHSAALIVDGETQQHGHAVAGLAARLGASLGVPPGEVNAVYWAALLHDVGKVGVKRSVLRKPSKLSADEFEAVKDHVAIGSDLVRSIGDSELLRSVSSMILHHHERWDGQGYPTGRSRNAIPLGARIIAITDVFEALISDRPYRSAMSPDAAVQIIGEGSGSHFDPDLVGVFLWMLSKTVPGDLGIAGECDGFDTGSTSAREVTGTRHTASARIAQAQDTARCGPAVISTTMV